jgi:Tfp pilus assembly protein PilO
MTGAKNDMRKSRRQILIHVVEKVGLALILLDTALYFAMLRPLQNWVGSEQQRFMEIRRRLRESSARVERLEKFQENLPGAGDRLEVFKRDHLPPRRHAFSRASRLLRKVSEQAGVELGPVVFRLDSEHKQPFERLGIETDAEGSFAGLMKFAHALETAGDFILIREFTFEPGESGSMGLRLTAELYLTP